MDVWFFYNQEQERAISYMLLVLKVEGSWLREDCLSHRPLWGWEGLLFVHLLFTSFRVLHAGG